MQQQNRKPPDKGGGMNRRRNQNLRKLPLSVFPALAGPSGSSSAQSVKGWSDPKGSFSSQSVKSAKDILLQEPKYFQNHVVETIVHLEPEEVLSRNDPWGIKEKYLNTQTFMLPEGHYRYVYEAMLTETQSVNIQHHRYDETEKKSALTYSKCQVCRVLFPSEWGFRPDAGRILNVNGQQFNYWDYVQAWYFAFYYQNGQRNHSWFFSINPNILKGKGFPSWFLLWWEKFGPTTEVLPSELKNQFLLWNQLHPQFRGISDPPIGKNTLWYFTDFRITWIWKWGIKFNFDHLKNPILQRTFFVKWWDKFDTTKAEEEIKKSIILFKSELEKENKKTLNSNSNVFEFLSEFISQNNPNLSSEEIQVEVLKTLKSQFLATATFSENSSMKSEDSGSFQPSRFSCLAGEAQDPNDDEDDHMEDYLDAMISLQEEKSKKKGKEIKSLDDL